MHFCESIGYGVVRTIQVIAACLVGGGVVSFVDVASAAETESKPDTLVQDLIRKYASNVITPTRRKANERLIRFGCRFFPSRN